MSHSRKVCPHGGLISTCRCRPEPGVEPEITVTERCPFGCGEKLAELSEEDENYDTSRLLSVRIYLSRSISDTMPIEQKRRLQALIHKHGYGPR